MNSYLQDGADWVRVVNAISAFVVLALLAWRMITVWRYFSASQKLTYTAIAFYILGIAWRTLEVASKDSHQPATLSLVPMFIGHTAMLAYLLEPKRRYASRLGEDLRYPENNKK